MPMRQLATARGLSSIRVGEVLTSDVTCSVQAVCFLIYGKHSTVGGEGYVETGMAWIISLELAPAYRCELTELVPTLRKLII